MHWGKRAVLILLAFGLGTGLRMFMSAAPKEPAYHGKSLTTWLKIYSNPENPTAYDLFPRPFEPLDPEAIGLFGPNSTITRRRERAEIERRQSEAAEAVRQIGTNAISTLFDLIDCDAPVPWKLKLILARDKLPRILSGGRFLDWWLVARDEYRIGQGISGFWLLGSNASSAVPELTARMATRNSRSGQLAVLALAKIGQNGLPPLLATLANTNARNRAVVARFMDETVRNLGPNAFDAVQMLARCVTDRDTSVALCCAIALGRVASEPKVSVPALSIGLRDPRTQVRARCAEALGHFGQAATPAIDGLLADLYDPDPFVKSSVQEALRKIAPTTFPPVVDK